MLTFRQMSILALTAVLFWIVATAAIRFFPGALVDPLRGDLAFGVSIPVCWLCVVAVRRWADLTREQLVAGVAFVAALAMLIDGSALRWAHRVYGDGAEVYRLGAAWLLWGYGVSLVIALAMAGGWGVSRRGAERPA